ncbi:hypothetical protein DINM_007313 [Dirofilaria immitis]|nr:hypothetical protein [Dirofilaria immitis]
MRKALRNPYIVLATTFFNSELTGISAILLGVKRIIASINGEQLIDHHKCVLNIPILLLTSFFLNGWNLLMNSVERLCVIAFPLYYYTHSTQISYSLVIIQYLITVIAITSTAVASLIEPSRQLISLLSVFVVLPSIAENIYMMETSTRSRVIVICCVYLRLLNCCNTVLLFAYRQSDLRQAAIRCIKNHLYGWKQHTLELQYSTLILHENNCGRQKEVPKITL